MPFRHIDRNAPGSGIVTNFPICQDVNLLWTGQEPSMEKRGKVKERKRGWFEMGVHACVGCVWSITVYWFCYLYMFIRINRFTPYITVAPSSKQRAGCYTTSVCDNWSTATPWWMQQYVSGISFLFFGWSLHWERTRNRFDSWIEIDDREQRRGKGIRDIEGPVRGRTE